MNEQHRARHEARKSTSATRNPTDWIDRAIHQYLAASNYPVTRTRQRASKPRRTRQGR